MNRAGLAGTFAISMAAGCAIAFDAFSEGFNSARFAIVLVALLSLHVLRFGRVAVAREAWIYACFVAYMLLEMTWTQDRALAMNTLVPAANFLLVLVLFVSLAVFHDIRAVMAGALAGFAAGAASYSSISGFPFRYPPGFSYNAIAGMYLFGFLLALLLATTVRRRVVLLIVAAVAGAHIVATTSIKTNLGILAGALSVGIAHFRVVSRLMWRHAIAILAVVLLAGYAVAGSEAARESLGRGADRVMLGIRILQAREDLPGYSSFERREGWQREGFRGWAANPVFGHGVEAFRSRFGLTSHASHVDILYNSGLIGIALFYGVFASMLLRLRRARTAGLRYTRMVILGGTICGLVISFAGTIHYAATLAGFLAIAIGILKRAQPTR